MTSRKLTPKQQTALRENNNLLADCKSIETDPDFNLSLIRNCVFSGDIKIGNHCKLYGSKIHNCDIGNNVQISNVTWLADYEIGDSVIMEAVGEISMSGESKFGNGCVLDILNEGGGREVCQRTPDRLRQSP